MKCFVDTSAFVALYHRSDAYHESAKSIWYRLKEQDAILCTTRDVIVETIVLVRHRGGFQQALLCGNDLWNSPVLEIVRPTQNHDIQAWEFFRRYSDKELSFVDCISFAVMKELRIEQAFTFDKNFTQVGFKAVQA